jgi:PAS domain-containing protein
VPVAGFCLEDGGFEEGICCGSFIFIMNLFYGFLVQSFEKRTMQFKQELEEVEASEQRYRQIVESAHDAVVVLDENNRLNLLSRSTHSLHSEELTGMELRKIMEEPAVGDHRHRPRSFGKRDRAFTADVFQGTGKRKAEISARNSNCRPGKFMVLYLKMLLKKADGGGLIDPVEALGRWPPRAHGLNNVPEPSWAASS